MPSARKAPKVYGPGEFAPVTGVYIVEHLGGHRTPHEVVIIRGEELPACRYCRAKVEFTVKLQASHVTHDIDFSGPTGLTLVHRQPEFGTPPKVAEPQDK